MGRIKFEDLTPEMKADSQDLLEKVNLLLMDFYKDYPDAAIRKVNSGYRRAEDNASAGGSKKSKHMLCQAIDLSDSDEKLDRWLTLLPEKLIKYDLYREHPDHTKNWCHLSNIPPKSKKRTFFP